MSTCLNKIINIEKIFHSFKKLQLDTSEICVPVGHRASSQNLVTLGHGLLHFLYHTDFFFLMGLAFYHTS